MRNRISNRPFLVAQLAALIFFLGLLTCSDALIKESKAQSKAATHLYFFTNDGCAPCRQVEPAVEALKLEGYPVTTIKLSERPQLGAQFRVKVTPTVVMVSDNKVVGYHAGLIDAVDLKKWFAARGIPSGDAFRKLDGNKTLPGQAKVPLRDARNQNSPDGFFGTNRNDRYSSPTMTKGTRRPGSAQEKLAMQATVRLKVEDAEGTSYATGTVIHSHQDECLVVTCGHVFRDAQGKGEITAEFGFENGRPQTASGHLIFYDSDARDIGLVSLRTPVRIMPVPIASRESSIVRGSGIFSIGCDHGEDPTIRRSKIKNRAAYDGAIKYDIYGRPVDGRSGGGLFTSDGELIGVCNAAAVEVDEGIYTALDTIHWQLAKVNLTHLFDGTTDTTRVALNQPVTMPVDGLGVKTVARSNAQPGQWRTDPSPLSEPAVQMAPIRPRPPVIDRRTDVLWNNHSQGTDGKDKEVIIILRSKTNPAQTEAITINDPTPQLINYLESIGGNPQSRQLDVARLRTMNKFQETTRR